MNTSPIERILKIDMVEATANGSIDIEAKHRAGVAEYNFAPTKILVSTGAALGIANVEVTLWGDPTTKKTIVPVITNFWHEMRVRVIHGAGTTPGAQIFLGGNVRD